MVLRTVLDGLIRRFLVIGSLSVRYPDGQTSFHQGPQPGSGLAFHVSDWRAVRRMAVNPALAFGEGYMDGAITPVGCSSYDALDLLGAAVKRWAQLNWVRQAARNAAHHYDLNGRLYALLLDDDRQYSCLFPHRAGNAGRSAGGEEAAHRREALPATGPARAEHRLRLGRSGADARAGARDARHRHHAVPGTARHRPRPGARGRPHRPGAVRAAGQPRAARPLQPHRLRRHVRACGDQPLPPVFPGLVLQPGAGRGGAGALHRPQPRSGLITTDIEMLRLHYAETLRHWRKRLFARRDAVAALYDKQFFRMFEFDLSGAELAFRHKGHMVWQMQLARRADAVPLTRNYITDAERPVARVPQPA